jgi:hypothetical protein
VILKMVNGSAHVGLRCLYCSADLVCDPSTGNYRCPTPTCGKGGISSPGGIVTVVDEAGNVTLSGKDRSG